MRSAGAGTLGHVLPDGATREMTDGVRELPDGVTLRRATPADAEQVRRFVAHLSPESAFRRFFTGVATPSRALTRQLVARDRDHGSWVAEHHGAIVGHASWARVAAVDEGPTTPDVAEIAVVIDDDHQRQGLGTALVRAVAVDAEQAGADVLRFVVMGDNRGVIAWLEHLWPAAVARTEDALWIYDVPATRAAA